MQGHVLSIPADLKPDKAMFLSAQNLKSYSHHEGRTQPTELSRLVLNAKKMKILCLHGNGTNSEVSFYDFSHMSSFN